MKLTSTDCLLVIDVQNDFCDGGPIPISGGSIVAERMAVLATYFARYDAPTFATQDWHPTGHISFNTRGGPWPPHCIQRTEGAKFHPRLRLPSKAKVIRKGSTPNKDAYSGFIDSLLEESLLRQKIKRVFIGGLSTDYMVLNTAIDALDLGLTTYVCVDAVDAINIEPNDGLRALHIMQTSGAHLTTTQDIMAKQSEASVES